MAFSGLNQTDTFLEDEENDPKGFKFLGYQLMVAVLSGLEGGLDVG